MAKVESITRLTLRLPDKIKERLEQRADSERRSLNAEIVKVLEQSLDAAPEHKQAA